ncbi:MAG TPA: RNA pseudouridine synthase [Candidatus Faecousia intestinigallinarum]|nr:RNA pseudouridine synthase [Candidatus Faecousia intestinigallinarum]
MEILYQDPQIAVCVKPVGMDAEQETPQALRAALGGEIYPLHRLDKAVGGVMVFARTRSAAAQLSRAMQDGTFMKEYIALVHGAPPAEGVWEDLLWKDAKKNKVFVVKRMRGGVRPAKLSYTRLTQGDASLVAVRLYTGRTHQIRVQFASRGFPLLGDHKYGARDSIAAPMLFSRRITFPYAGKIRSFEALPPWAELQNVKMP